MVTKDGLTPVANLRYETPDGTERSHKDIDAQPSSRRKPFTIQGVGERPPRDTGNIHQDLSNDARRRKFWWSKLFIGTVVWDVTYLVVLPVLTGTYPDLNFVHIPEDIRVFTNTVTAIVTAGVILSVTELPLLPWSNKR